MTKKRTEILNKNVIKKGSVCAKSYQKQLLTIE